MDEGGAQLIRILGPLDVVSDGRGLSVGGERQRVLLAVLALRANEVVTTDELVDSLFPRGGSGALHTAISRLRRVVGADRIETHPSGYVLRADAQGLDAIAAREAAVRAAELRDLRARAEALRKAEALWRGPVFAGMDLPASFRPDAELLNELRRSVIADRIDTELELGRHADLVGELDALTRSNPFDERLHRARALALYRSGRQADALAVVADYGRTLREELGLEPSAELRDLERAILTHHPSLRPPHVVAGDERQAESGPRVSAKAFAAGLTALVAALAVIAVAVEGGSDGTPLSELRPGAVAVVPFGSTHAERTYDVGRVPRAVAVGFGATWVGDLTSQTVVRIGRGGEITTSGIGLTPTGLTAGAGSVWVVAGDEGVVIRLEPSSGRVLDRVRLRPGLTDIAAGSGSVWVTNADAGTLTQIGGLRGELVSTLEGLARPAGVVVAGGHVWVAERFGRRLTRLDVRGGRVLDRIPVDLPPGDLAATDGAVWATNQGAGTVTRVDMRARTADVISVGRLPSAIAASADVVYVLNDLDHSISEIDARRREVVRTLSLSDPVSQTPSQITPGGIAAADKALWLTAQSY